MDDKFQFRLVEIMPLEDFLRLTPEDRLKENNRMANRVLEIEKFMNSAVRGWKFIQSQHGHTR